MLTKKKTTGVKWITRSELNEYVDSSARRVLKVAGKKFISNWKAGSIGS
jgi:hypothetical protein